MPEGSLTATDTSNEEQMEVVQSVDKDNHGAPDDKIPPYQEPKDKGQNKWKKEGKRLTKMKTNNDNQKDSRKHRFSQTQQSAEHRITHHEQAIRSLKRHSKKGTCPEPPLQYKAKAGKRADVDFKTDINLRKKHQTRILRALTCFHYFETDCLKGEMRRLKRPKRSKHCWLQCNHWKCKTNHWEYQTNVARLNELMEIVNKMENKQSGP